MAVPSRSRVETYKQLKHQVDEMVGRINGEHGTIGWMPVWYLYRSFPFTVIWRTNLSGSQVRLENIY